MYCVTDKVWYDQLSFFADPSVNLNFYRSNFVVRLYIPNVHLT
jgi:hypothetical protein